MLALPFSVLASKGVHDGADNRCNRGMPSDAWGYTVEWEWGEFAFICRYKGGDYNPTGQERRVGLTDLL